MFATVFVLVLLIMVSVALAIRSKRLLMRLGFAGLALLVFAGLVGGVFYLTLFPPAPESASLTADDTAAEHSASTAASSQPTVKQPRHVHVELDAPAVTVSAVNEKESPESAQPKWQPLSLETDARLTVDTPEQRERVIVGRKLRTIEAQLNDRLDRLAQDSRSVTQGFRSHHFDNYDALTKQSTIRVQTAELVIQAMHDKLSVLHAAQAIPRSEVEQDKARALERLQIAEQQRQGYQNALVELRNNEATFRHMGES